jgi:hypothetical protein
LKISSDGHNNICRLSTQPNQEAVIGREDHHTENTTKEQVSTEMPTRVRNIYEELVQMQSKFDEHSWNLIINMSSIYLHL